MPRYALKGNGKITVKVETKRLRPPFSDYIFRKLEDELRLKGENTATFSPSFSGEKSVSDISEVFGGVVRYLKDNPTASVMTSKIGPEIEQDVIKSGHLMDVDAPGITVTFDVGFVGVRPYEFKKLHKILTKRKLGVFEKVEPEFSFSETGNVVVKSRYIGPIARYNAWKNGYKLKRLYRK
ncbi:MAG: hypothetical protein JSV39_03405 [Candidatus Aenigmatarchaeota archaeon]|nr:MAG: hypothetical protein JSV39_03405 [Candidatus Aenigmarchaeota archaeon]